jgi:hypothetical protein
MRNPGNNGSGGDEYKLPVLGLQATEFLGEPFDSV